jgi:hypothetical protein
MDANLVHLIRIQISDAKVHFFWIFKARFVCKIPPVVPHHQQKRPDPTKLDPISHKLDDANLKHKELHFDAVAEEYLPKKTST